MYPKDYFKDHLNDETENLCFVLMPFGKDYDDFYEAVIKETVESCGIKTLRADNLFGTNPIIKDVLENITKAGLVIADLTDKNPNVFYELGLTHSVKEIAQVILITDNINHVPSDLRHLRCVVYDKSFNGAETFKKTLTQTIIQLKSTPFLFGNYTWKQIKLNWYVQKNIMVADNFNRSNFPLIYCTKDFSFENFKLKFEAITDICEINIIICGDGIERFSGYHIWFWKHGVKVRRKDEEIFHETKERLKPNTPYKIEVTLSNKRLKMKINNKIALDYVDKYSIVSSQNSRIGFNTWADGRGTLKISNIEISE